MNREQAISIKHGLFLVSQEETMTEVKKAYDLAIAISQDKKDMEKFRNEVNYPFVELGYLTGWLRDMAEKYNVAVSDTMLRSVTHHKLCRIAKERIK